MKYKNISKEEQTLIGYGKFKPDETVNSNTTINNANFEIVVEQKKNDNVVDVELKNNPKEKIK